MSPLRSSRGFTLLEVMVALAIVGLALSAAAISLLYMTNAASSLRDRTYASWIGQNRIAEIRLAGSIPEVDTTSGEVEFAGREWRWDATVSETGVENLLRVDVNVGLADEEAAIWQTSGFAGEPFPAGVSSQAWIAPQRSRENER